MSTSRDPADRSLLVLTAAEVEAALPLTVAIDSQSAAFRSVVDGSGSLNTAAYATDASTDTLVFALTGMIRGSTGLVSKVGLQLPNNPARGLPNIQAAVLVFDPDTGAPVACLNGNALTTLRTSAGLAVAADALSNPSAKTLGVIGSGPQAVAAVRMIAQVRHLERVTLWSPSAAARDLAVASLTAECPFEVEAAPSVMAVVAAGEIVAACTRSRTPVILGEWLRPGQTMLTIGSYAPDRREIDLAATARASTVVDLMSKSRTMCGPLLEALGAGLLVESDVTEIGAVLLDPRAGRHSPDDIFVFHSLGIGAQDAAAGWAAYERASQLGIGQRVNI
jgi:ornithine cyclodeaminase/alanine dehydrogenase-like protein (mu-crystallin family)